MCSKSIAAARKVTDGRVGGPRRATVVLEQGGAVTSQDTTAREES